LVRKVALSFIKDELESLGAPKGGNSEPKKKPGRKPKSNGSADASTATEAPSDPKGQVQATEARSN
jgi:hypothetical protein